MDKRAYSIIELLEQIQKTHEDHEVYFEYRVAEQQVAWQIINEEGRLIYHDWVSLVTFTEEGFNSAFDELEAFV